MNWLVDILKRRLNFASGSKITTPIAPIVGCSDCFHDLGFRHVLRQCSNNKSTAPCPSCGSLTGVKLTHDELWGGAIDFFNFGSSTFGNGNPIAVLRVMSDRKYFDEFGTQELRHDIRKLNKSFNLSCEYAAPSLWKYMKIDENGNEDWSDEELEELISSCEVSTIHPGEDIFRARLNLKQNLIVDSDFCSPPLKRSEFGRFDSDSLQVLYASRDIETCIHETRSVIKDEIFAATLTPTKPINLVNLTNIKDEVDGHYFVRYPMWVRSLLYSNAEESYLVCRRLAKKIHDKCFDGFVSLSYYDQASANNHENVSIFGAPITSKLLKVQSINRIRITDVSYKWSYGPAIFED